MTKDKINTVVFSGGTGSNAIQQGLFESGRFNDQYLINLYDDGLSTGICRDLFKMPGPSDLRKVQSHQHFIRYGKTPLYRLLTQRITYKNKQEGFEYLTNELNKIHHVYVPELMHSIETFFEHYNLDLFEDFSVGNMLYAGYYMNNQTNIYETKSFFARLLEIPETKVIINTDLPLNLVGITSTGKRIEKEYLLDHSSKSDPHQNVWTEDKSGQIIIPEANKETVDAIKNAELIIISCGNYWTSIIPTLQTKGVTELINQNKNAKKIIIMNKTHASDMIGMNSDQIMPILYKYMPQETVTIMDLNSPEGMRKGIKDCQYYTLPLSLKHKYTHDSNLLYKSICSLVTY